MKKGIELSINFLVTVIIAIVIFGLGVKFIYNIVSESEDFEGLTLKHFDEMIGDLSCESTDKVCIPENRVAIQRGKFDVVGIKIINVLTDTTSKDFEITADVSKILDKNDNIITDPVYSDNLDKIKIKYTKTVDIKKNEEADVGVGIKVEKDAISGTHILDVKVEQYEELYKIYVKVP